MGKSLIRLLIIGLILSLTACGSSTENTSPPLPTTPATSVAIIASPVSSALPTLTIASPNFPASSPVSTQTKFATSPTLAKISPASSNSPTVIVIVASTPTPEKVFYRTATAVPPTATLPTATFTPLPQAVYTASSGPDAEEQRFLQLLNAYRKENGRNPLSFDAQLFSSARWMAQDMAGKPQVSHTDSQGRDIFKRIKDFGYAGRNVGENIAGGLEQAEANLNIWQSDDIHKNNLLGSNYTKAAAGRFRANSSAYSWFWVLDLG